MNHKELVEAAERNLAFVRSRIVREAIVGMEAERLTHDAEGILAHLREQSNRAAENEAYRKQHDREMAEWRAKRKEQTRRLRGEEVIPLLREGGWKLRKFRGGRVSMTKNEGAMIIQKTVTSSTVESLVRKGLIVPIVIRSGFFSETEFRLADQPSREVSREVSREAIEWNRGDRFLNE